MAIFKCKMCGGALEIIDGVTIVECEYCGTKQTVPKLDQEEKAALYDRASHFRRNNEFDIAMSIYEQILAADKTDAEAYWSLVLCRYGIEYVEEPDTKKRVPTVNRAQFTSVFDDEDYKAALEHADHLQKEIYIKEAKTIDEIQKGILAISQKEKPFDIFICYKESDANGRRTIDSVLAYDLYKQLTEEGYKVFFSRVTLEDKLGIAYEPYIFAALNSAKIMLVVGTKPEHFNAVWVKNEWSRYLALTKKNAKKLLIPCYRDMDPYDLPRELLHLQAQDMSKLGFAQDILHGINKIIPKKSDVGATSGERTAQDAGLKDLFLTNAFVSLKNGDFTGADEYVKKVLDIDPENVQAYIAKLMIDLKVRKQEDLAKQKRPFDKNPNYITLLQYCDENTATTFKKYIEDAKHRAKRKKITNISVTLVTSIALIIAAAIYVFSLPSVQYNYGVWLMNSQKYEKAEAIFEKLGKYEDSLSKLTEVKKAIAYNDAVALMDAGKYDEAIVAFKKIYGYKDSVNKTKECNAAIREQKYNDAVALMCSGKYNEAIIVFEEIYDYKDSVNKINECNAAIREQTYNNAISSMGSGKYIEAYETFVDLGDYKDSVMKAQSIYEEYKREKLKIAKVGDYVIFGKYEQDDNVSNGKEDVEWLVLEVKDGKAFVISKYALDCKPYNEEHAQVTWETCTLRKWLNDEFVDSTFSADEKMKISTVKVSADNNPIYTTEPGNETYDQVFLLSVEEVDKYFNVNNIASSCKATAYAISKGACVDDSNGNCIWWMRTPGTNLNYATYVTSVGGNHNLGYFVSIDDTAVRPAMWIDLNS